MCMKYEDIYGDCFDHLYDGLGIPGSYEGSFKELLDNWNIKVIEPREVELRFIRLIETWHELGLIEPETPDVETEWGVRMRDKPVDRVCPHCEGVGRQNFEYLKELGVEIE